MRGRYPMSEQYEPRPAALPAPAARQARAGIVDLLAFFGALALAAGLTLLADRSGPLSARLVFAGAAGLMSACVATWRRLRRRELCRWRSGQIIFRSRRMVMVSAWGVEGQQVPAIEPLAAPGNITPPRAVGALDEHKTTVHSGEAEQHHAGHRRRCRSCTNRSGDSRRPAPASGNASPGFVRD